MLFRSEQVHGNKAVLRKPDGSRIEDAHLEDMVLVPATARLLEPEPLTLTSGNEHERDAETARRSLGEIAEAREEVRTQRQEDLKGGTLRGKEFGKLDKLTAGQYVAYTAEVNKPKDNPVSVGRITALLRPESVAVVHRHKIGRAHV